MSVDPHPDYETSDLRVPPRLLVRRAFRRQCPICGSSDAWTGWWSLSERCPVCGYQFTRQEGGYFLGAMAINLISTEWITMLVLIGLLIGTSWNWWQIELLVVPIAIVLPLLAFPFARGLWMALDLTLTPKNQR